MLLILKRCVLRPGWLLAPCVLALLSAGPASARSWDAIDALRDRLTRAGVRVVQQDCSRRGLQGLITHAVTALWCVVPTERQHRCGTRWPMRPPIACSDAPAVRSPISHHRAMYAALSRSHPDEVRSMRGYPRQQQLAELEARYTAKLPPKEVFRLFDRYCA